MPLKFLVPKKSPAKAEATPAPTPPKTKGQPKAFKLTRDTTVHNPEAVIATIQSGSYAVKSSAIQWGPKLGEGANAQVYKAKVALNEGPQVCVAKRLKNGLDIMSSAYKDLMMELDIMSSIMKHPNIVHFYGACVDDPSNPIILEELVEGPDLEDYLSKRIGKKLPKPTVFKWSLDLLCGLDFMHNRDPIIIHRDLKPANLMLSKDLETLKVADFGMSKKVEASDRLSATHKGHTGSLRYMAPEVAFQHTAQYTEKADIYSAAIIMWFLAVTVRPTHVTRDKVDPKSRPDLKAVAWPALAKLIADMWKLSPEERPSAREGIQRLHSFPDKPMPHERVAPPAPKATMRTGFE